MQSFLNVPRHFRLPVFTAILLLGTSSSFASVYEKEIAIVERNHRALLDQADEIFRNGEEFRRIWERVAVEMRLLQGSFRSTRTPSLGNTSEMQVYARMIRERVLVSIASSALATAAEGIAAEVEASGALCRRAEYLCERHESTRSAVERRLQAIRGELDSRSRNIEHLFSVWQDQQIEAWSQREIAERQQFLAGLQVERMIERIPQILMKVRMRARLAVIGGRRREAADWIAAGAWFRGAVPVFFADKALSGASQTRLNTLLRDSETAEKALIQELGKHGVVMGDQAIPSATSLRFPAADAKGPGDSGSPAWDGNYAKNRDVDDDDSDNEAESPGWKPEQTGSGARTHDGWDFTRDGDVTPESKVVSERDGSTPADIVSPSYTLDRYDGDSVAESVGVESPDVTRELLTDYADVAYNGNQNDTPAREIHSGENVSDLVGRARNSISSRKQSEFKKLEEAVQRWRTTTELFKRTVADSERRVTESMNGTLRNAADLRLPVLGEGLTEQSLHSLFSDESADFFARANQNLQNFSSGGVMQDLSRFFAPGLTLARGKSFERAAIKDILEELEGVPAGSRSLQNPATRWGVLQNSVVKTYDPAKPTSPASLAAFDELGRYVQSVFGIQGPAVPLSAAKREEVRGILAFIANHYPVVGPAIQFHEVITGRNFFTGERLPDRAWALSALELVFSRAASLEGDKLLEGIATALTVGGWAADQVEKVVNEVREWINVRHVKSSERFDHVRPGPLKNVDPAKSAGFRTDSYWGVSYAQPRSFFALQEKVYSTGKLPSVWSESDPRGPVRTGPDAGMVAKIILEISVPAGTKVFVDANGNTFIDQPDPSWIQNQRRFL